MSTRSRAGGASPRPRARTAAKPVAEPPVPAGDHADRRAPVQMVVTHLTRAERVARGKEARKRVPRASHAAFDPAARPDPVALLEEQGPSRMQDLLPIRYGRMMASPFAFYRGAALVMATDLAKTPVSGMKAQICGDAHLANFGAFGSPERRLLFDMNDFDETLPGPWEWDVKRLAASFEIAGRENGHKAKARAGIIQACVRAYREGMAQFAGMTNLQVWYASLDVETVIERERLTASKAAVAKAERNVAKAKTRDSMQALGKLTEMVDGAPRIKSVPPLVERIEDLFPGVTADQLTLFAHEQLRQYRRTLQHDRRVLLEQYQFVDVARKVVGVGSVGTRCMIVLLMGIDGGDPLFLQVKEAQASVLERFHGRSVYRNSGHRVVAGQRMMQAASDVFLGYQSFEGIDGVTRDFYWRQLRDWKGSAEVDGMDPAVMATYARACGWTLARAHARTGDRVAIAAYLGGSDTFDRAIAEFSTAYADQNEKDHAALCAAVESGRLAAQTGI